MNDQLERLDQLHAEIAQLREQAALLEEQAAAIGGIITCSHCQQRVLAPFEQGLPRGWLQMLCHSSGHDSYFCPEHWDTACLDNTDYWYSGGESIRLPFGKGRWWNEGRWRRIKKKFGAK